MNVDLTLGSHKIFFPRSTSARTTAPPTSGARSTASSAAKTSGPGSGEHRHLRQGLRERRPHPGHLRLLRPLRYQNIGTYRDSELQRSGAAFLDNSLNFSEQAPNASGGFGEALPVSFARSNTARRPLLLLRHHSPGRFLKFGANNRSASSLPLRRNLTEIPWVVGGLDRIRQGARLLGPQWKCRPGIGNFHLRRLQRPELHVRPDRCRSMEPAPSPRPTRT